MWSTAYGCTVYPSNARNGDEQGDGVPVLAHFLRFLPHLLILARHVLFNEHELPGLIINYRKKAVSEYCAVSGEAPIILRFTHP